MISIQNRFLEFIQKYLLSLEVSNANDNTLIKNLAMDMLIKNHKCINAMTEEYCIKGGELENNRIKNYHAEISLFPYLLDQMLLHQEEFFNYLVKTYKILTNSHEEYVFKYDVRKEYSHYYYNLKENNVLSNIFIYPSPDICQEYDGIIFALRAYNGGGLNRLLNVEGNYNSAINIMQLGALYTMYRMFLRSKKKGFKISQNLKILKN